MRSPQLPGELFDPGLQPERTRLSWQRTLLALAVIFLGVMRVVSVTVFIPLAVLAVGGLVWNMAVRKRASLVDASLRAHHHLPGAAVLAGGAGLVSLLAAFALWGVFA
ncbi:DUF202 domain-containing protein [Corynebacterium macginleyi]|uniref:DUF202 domain-containing protein n=1 Tax=Corynebacterium macginleyi TaxID=38290 RepID=UPI000EFA0D64|nr:DUF202 domain-containing protein [Corynebacterium macginleyi]MBK4151904.1 DUF202 domain-containing protein [Corynebacterium macginleyi]QRP21481.1 DUF202 domain-containing protein [Corynebacterium macginleyi]RMB67150.1 DUF202 domain-containing protein [Corynebacterium macginleyi]